MIRTIAARNRNISVASPPVDNPISIEYQRSNFPPSDINSFWLLCSIPNSTNINPTIDPRDTASVNDNFQYVDIFSIQHLWFRSNNAVLPGQWRISFGLLLDPRSCLVNLLYSCAIVTNGTRVDIAI